jgi:hypothetical protein
MSRTGPLDPLTAGGISYALVGTAEQTGMALVCTVPLGIACAIYIREVQGPAARFTRVVVEAMTALPSIVAGQFIYVVAVLSLGLGRSGLSASLSMSVMMLPVIIRAAAVTRPMRALGRTTCQQTRRCEAPVASAALRRWLGTKRKISSTTWSRSPRWRRFSAFLSWSPGRMTTDRPLLRGICIRRCGRYSATIPSSTGPARRSTPSKSQHSEVRSRPQGRRRLVMAGLMTEGCLLQTALTAVADGYEVFAVVDACAGETREGHDTAIQRTVQAGVVPATWYSLAAEYQRKWTNQDTVAGFTRLIADHSAPTAMHFAVLESQHAVPAATA